MITAFNNQQDSFKDIERVFDNTILVKRKEKSEIILVEKQWISGIQKQIDFLNNELQYHYFYSRVYWMGEQ